jgi:uncharacterized membrane protein (UPF0127 family)
MSRNFSIFSKGALAALFVIWAGVALAQSVIFPKDTLSIRTAAGKTYEFSIELALSDAQREQGLMYRKEMAADHGMLFDFGESRRVQMWMENTILPLDMVFISGDGKISAIRENAVPFSRDIIDSGAPVKFVLELNAGRAKALGLRIGDKVINQRIGNSG